MADQGDVDRWQGRAMCEIQVVPVRMIERTMRGVEAGIVLSLALGSGG